MQKRMEKEVKGLWMRLTEEKKRGEKQQERDKRRMKTDGGERRAEKETRVKGWWRGSEGNGLRRRRGREGERRERLPLYQQIRGRNG